MANQSLGAQGVLNVIPPAALEAQLAAQDQQAAQNSQASQPTQTPQELVAYIRSQWEIFRNHRNTSAGWSERLLIALRAFNGQYDTTKLQEIRKFGGSEVYARIIAQKCRAASSLLRDIYLGEDRPWAVRPPAEPDILPEIIQNIDKLMDMERQQVTQTKGSPPDPNDEWQRRQALMESAEDAAKKKAADQARESEDRLEDILRSGGFYEALAQFIVDIPIFPFAVLKGPTVKIVPQVEWPQGGGQPTVNQKPILTWSRVSPFDIWWTPGVSDIVNANVIEKSRLTRAEINDMLDLPGYNQDEVRAVLDEYGRGGLWDNWDTTDAERAVLESRENPAWNRSAMISMMEFNGNIQGRMLQDYGLAVPDELRDYHCQVWCIGSHVVKAQLSPSPRQRHPYFITSFEKVPGTPVGNGLTDMLSDIQEVANANLRALVNNLSIASGPQVVVNDDRLTPEETGEDLYPWKRWHVRNDPSSPSGPGAQPISFFMPADNSQNLMTVYQAFIGIADDVSAIPKYVGGQAGAGGAGRTASGLAMLMGNASKILQTVSANIDRDVIEQALTQLSDLILLTDTTGILTGEERISVQGVAVAVQRETLRQRQIEFLQATNNPTDQKIVGIKGRGAVLRSVSSTIGLQGEEVVPSDQALEQMQQQETQQQQNQPYAQKVQEGVQKGVEQGIQSITKELTAGAIAQQMGVPEGPPTHIGTPEPSQPGAPGTNNPQMGLGMEQRAAQAQGNQRGPLTGGGEGPQGLAPRTNTVGQQPGKGALPISPGVG